MAAPLRVVHEGDKPKPTSRKRHTVATAARDGDRLDLLIAMRDRIATAVADEKCPPRDLAALTKRLDDIVEKIAVLTAATEGEDGDGGPAEDESFDPASI